jgi:hypothetical protein
VDTGSRRRANVEAAREAQERARRQWEEIAAAAGQATVFEFARALRGGPWSREATAAGVADYIENVHEQAGEAGNAWDALDRLLVHSDSGDTRADFIAAWDRVRIVPGDTPWSAAEKSARAHPLIPNFRPSAKYVRFISFAGGLQRVARPGAPIILPCERFASTLGVSARMVSEYRHWAIARGLLHVVREHNRASGEATEFRFALDRFDAQGREIGDPR